MVEDVPEGTHGNVKAVTGVFGDMSSSVAHSLALTLGSTSALHRPALPSSEMPHSMRNGHKDLASCKCIPVLQPGGFPGDVTINEK